MKVSTKLIIGIVLIAALVGLFLYENNSDSESIRLGYMTLWAEGSFPAEAMREAGIAERHNLNVSYVKVQYGPPLVEAALSGQVDIIFTGWVPAVNLMSKSDDWVIVGKLAYFPMSLMARNGSNVHSVKDLEGMKVGVGYGTGPYPLVIDSLQNVGLIPGKNVEVINLKATDMGVALKTAQVNAVSWAEPSLTLFKQQGLAYSIEDYNDIGFIVVNKQFLKEHPNEVREFLEAFKESELYFAQNKEQVYKWFSEESQFDISLIKSLSYTEPNFNAKSIGDIDISISKEWIISTQKKIEFEYNQKIIEKNVNLTERIDLSYLK